MKNIAILLLAAGESSRMRGADKLMEPVGGAPLLAVMVERASATGQPVLVALPRQDHPRARCIGAAQPVLVPDADEGMAASIRRGVQAVPTGCDGVMILPADMPEITTADLNQMIAACDTADGDILRAVSRDAHGTEHAGHPVIFPRRCFEALQQISGDQGARGLLSAQSVKTVVLPKTHALTDLDTPEAWERWRRAPQHPQET